MQNKIKKTLIGVVIRNTKIKDASCGSKFIFGKIEKNAKCVTYIIRYFFQNKHI